MAFDGWVWSAIIFETNKLLNGLNWNLASVLHLIWFHGDVLAWWREHSLCKGHYSDVIMGRMASQITSFTIVYSTVYSSAD